jgi:hypothetical protein
MYKIVSISSRAGAFDDSGPTNNYALPAGNDYTQSNSILLANIVEIISLIIKNMCENTSYEVINNSELGGPAIKSLIAAALMRKIKEKAF